MDAEAEIAKEFEARRRATGFGTIIMEKVKADPIVPAGALATAAVLLGGFRSFLKADSVTSQKMMRGRVMAQGFTIVAIGVGTLLARAADDGSSPDPNPHNR